MSIDCLHNGAVTAESDPTHHKTCADHIRTIPSPAIQNHRTAGLDGCRRQTRPSGDDHSALVSVAGKGYRTAWRLACRGGPIRDSHQSLKAAKACEVESIAGLLRLPKKPHRTFFAGCLCFPTDIDTPARHQSPHLRTACRGQPGIARQRALRLTGSF